MTKPWRRDHRPRASGVFLVGATVALPYLGLLAGCGARDDLGSSATIAVDTVDETAAPTATTPGSTAAPVTSAELEVDTAVPTTNASMVSDIPVTAAAPVINDASVQALAAVLGVDGELEQRDGEHGAGQCVRRLEPRGLCVNVPLWGVWQYWDLSAQDTPGASDDQASMIAVNLFAQLGVDPGAVTSIEPNGPLPQVKFSSGALVMVAEDGRIAMVIAGTNLLPVS